MSWITLVSRNVVDVRIFLIRAKFGLSTTNPTFESSLRQPFLAIFLIFLSISWLLVPSIRRINIHTWLVDRIHRQTFKVLVSTERPGWHKYLPLLLIYWCIICFLLEQISIPWLDLERRSQVILWLGRWNAPSAHCFNWNCSLLKLRMRLSNCDRYLLVCEGSGNRWRIWVVVAWSVHEGSESVFTLAVLEDARSRLAWINRFDLYFPSAGSGCCAWHVWFILLQFDCCTHILCCFSVLFQLLLELEILFLDVWHFLFQDSLNFLLADLGVELLRLWFVLVWVYNGYLMHIVYIHYVFVWDLRSCCLHWKWQLWIIQLGLCQLIRAFGMEKFGDLLHLWYCRDIFLNFIRWRALQLYGSPQISCRLAHARTEHILLLTFENINNRLVLDHRRARLRGRSCSCTCDFDVLLVHRIVLHNKHALPRRRVPKATVHKIVRYLWRTQNQRWACMLFHLRIGNHLGWSLGFCKICLIWIRRRRKHRERQRRKSSSSHVGFGRW